MSSVDPRQAALSSTESAVGPSVCIPTSRNLTRKAFQCGLYEAQDVMIHLGAEMLGFEATSRFKYAQPMQRKFLYWDPSGAIANFNPALIPQRLGCEYDLFVVACHSYWDLLYLNAIKDWRDKCKVKVCWISELWASLIPKYRRHWLHLLKQFDHIFLSSHGSVAPLSEVIEKPCRWLSGGVDTLRFTPYPNPPARVIDVYSVGRRQPRIHEALLDAVGRRGIFYVHDTFQGAEAEPYDHRQHRDIYGNVAKRSRFFMVAPGKVNEQKETGGQVELGFRYFEGASAGAILIGQPPDCHGYRECFPWRDAVITIRTDGSDVMDVLNDLMAQPERMAAISKRNAVESLFRHDWLYRWKEILRVAGIQPWAAMEARERQLHKLAKTIVESDQRGLAAT
jgi:hypothetical protein